jgi:thiamine kinase-like enzyme
VDLPWEVRVLEDAGSAGLAPRLVYFDVDGAVLLTCWAEGRSWVPQEAAVLTNLDRIAALLRRVHALAVPMPARLITPLQWIQIYDEAMSRQASHSSDPVLRREALVRAQAWLELPRAIGVVCHSDLHTLNLIQENDSLILLDWEYAHVTDPLWDLAGWCANNDFDAELQWGLLRRYLGNAPILSEWHRFKLLLALYDYVCLLWSQLYLSVRGEEAHGVAERARLLDARLHLPAHYAA